MSEVSNGGEVSGTPSIPRVVESTTLLTHIRLGDSLFPRNTLCGVSALGWPTLDWGDDCDWTDPEDVRGTITCDRCVAAWGRRQ